MDEPTEGDQRFMRYLEDYGYARQHHPDLGIQSCPDFLVERGDRQMVCEVKQFTTKAISNAIETAGGYTALSDQQVFGSIREQIRAAARQMRDLRDSGMPLVVVLTNPLQAMISLRTVNVLAAMYGNLAYHQAIGPDGAVGKGTTFTDRDGVLTNDRQYVSAVATLHEVTAEQDWADENVKRFDDPFEFLVWANQQKERPHGSRRYVHVIHTKAAAEGVAVPLPDDVFDSPDDKHYRYDGLNYLVPAD